eukprot:gene3492-4353_t
MATLQTRATARIMMSPAVILLFLWMIVPLVMTLYFSFLRYNLLMPGTEEYIGFLNYQYFLTDPAFFTALANTLILVGGTLLITVIGGILLALVLDQPFFGQGIVRLLVIAPFFVMPTVSALVWKNMLMHPVNGLFAWIARLFGFQPIDWFAQMPLFSIILIVAWQWLPFATLILLTALQSLDGEQKEAAEMDGAGAISRFIYLVLPHLSRAITVVILIQTIFLLSVFAEILVTTNGGPGIQTTNITYLIYMQALLQFDVGGASAGGIVAVVLANIVAFFLIRLIGKNLESKVIFTVIGWTIGFLIFFPILWTFLTSFKSEGTAVATPPQFLFFDWTLENYREVQSRSDYFKHFTNSVVISVGSTLIGLALAIPAAWAMAFSPTKRTKDILMWMLSTKMMPAVGVLVPLYLIFRDWGLLDTRLGLVAVLTMINLPIIVWMLYTYFKEIPGEILEAARMDGASLMKEIVYVLTPMAVPGIASTMLLNIILAWNEAFWTLNLTAANAAPLTAFIASYSSPEGLFWAKLSAASTMAIAPILIMGWFSQKQLVRGLTFGAVK